MDVDRARDLLTARLAELDENARFAERARAEHRADPAAEGAVGQHPGDFGTEVADAMGAQLLIDTVADQRRLVLDALARLEKGTYGRCAVCDREIDDERLEARPEVATCREHADTPVVV